MKFFSFVIALVTSFFSNVIPQKSTPTVLSEKQIVVEEASPSASARSHSPLPTPIVPKSSSNVSSQIIIKTDPVTSSQKILYPNAQKKSDAEFITQDAASSVFDWYLKKLEESGYKITSKIRAKANEEFKGTITAHTNTDKISLSITQKNLQAETIIIFN